jgi:ABC-type antimicrobial peptide transport system permease subunit
MWKNYINIAFRNLKRHPLFSFINVAGLSIGLALCMLIVLYLKDEKSFDMFHAKNDRIYRLVRDNVQPDKTIQTDGNTGMISGPTFTAGIPEIERFVRLQSEGLSMKVGEEVFDQNGLYADSSFFSVFDFPLKYGNAGTALRDMYSIVISTDVAKKLFGTEAALGKTVELPLGDNGAFIPFQVTGIVPNSPLNSSINIKFLLPIQLNERNGGGDKNWINFYLNTFFLLAPGTDIAKVESKMQALFERNAKDEIKMIKDQFHEDVNMKMRLQALPKMHLDTDYVASNGLVKNSKPIYGRILTGIALFILMIACINFVNLTLARSLKRAKEIGIRKVVGGERRQIIIQFLGETMVLCLFAFLMAVVLAMLALPIFNLLSGKSLAFGYLLDWKLVLLYVALFFGTSLLAGFYPAFVLSGFDPVKTLYNRVRFSGKNYLAHSLVVLQFCIAAFLIISTITIYRQFNHLTRMDLGYDDKNLIMLRTGQLKGDKVAAFKAELMKDPSIVTAAARQGGGWFTVAKVDGENQSFALEVMDASFSETYKVPIVMGRNMNLTADSTSSAIINEAFMKKMGWKDLNNRQIDFFYDSIKYNVVGVVKDHHFESLYNDIKPQVYIMHPKYTYGELAIKIQEGTSQRAIQHIQKTSKAMFPLVPFNYEFKQAANEQQYEEEKKFKDMITYSAMLAIFISCIGLFGLATLAAERRTKEIGIRKVLGASVMGITSRLSLRFLQLVMLSVTIAMPLAWLAMSKWLENYIYRITVGPWVFVFTVFALVIIALATVGIQAVRAARANPVKSLRTE